MLWSTKDQSGQRKSLGNYSPLFANWWTSSQLLDEGLKGRTGVLRVVWVLGSGRGEARRVGPAECGAPRVPRAHRARAPYSARRCALPGPAPTARQPLAFSPAFRSPPLTEQHGASTSVRQAAALSGGWRAGGLRGPRGSLWLGRGADCRPGARSGGRQGGRGAVSGGARERERERGVEDARLQLGRAGADSRSQPASRASALRTAVALKVYRALNTRRPVTFS